MKRNKRVLMAIVGLMVVAFFCGFAAAAETMTIKGTINDDGQLVADDGKVYEIAESEKGSELSAMVGKKVTVTGAVEENEGKMEIEVESYETAE